MRNLIFSILVFFFVGVGSASVYAQSPKRTEYNSFRSKFRYVVVYSELERSVKKGKYDTRFVDVLIDKRAFSVQNLRILFDLLSKRFPKPHTLFVTVYTDLEDIETPEEHERGRFSETTDSTDLPNEQDTAIFTREGRTKNVVINYANGDVDEFDIDR